MQRLRGGWMRRLCLALCLLPAVAGARAADMDRPVPLQVAGAKYWDMRASESRREYRIFVAAPDRPPPAEGYGVLYVLDANAMFLTAVEAVRAFERRPDVPRDIATVVVGIGYPEGSDIHAERTLDLTPVPAEDPRLRRMAGGGADAFLAFVEHDLKPKLDGMFPLDKRKQAIFGHSFAGLFVLHTLVRRPDAFQSRIAASPSLWYGDGVVKHRLREFAGPQPHPGPRARLLLTAGEFEQSLSPAMRAQPGADRMAERLRERAQVDNAREAAAVLGDMPGIEARFDEIAGEDHGSVIPAAIGRAVAFMLSPPPAPPVPTAQEYLRMTPQQRYELRLRVRDLPDPERIPWLERLKQTLHAGLSAEQVQTLHEERNRMDQENGTRPHAVNASK
ncbi:MAG: alpha/beta hydrolase-fold protein [Pseudoxanthomonas sp.]